MRISALFPKNPKILACLSHAPRPTWRRKITNKLAHAVKAASTIDTVVPESSSQMIAGHSRAFLSGERFPRNRYRMPQNGPMSSAREPVVSLPSFTGFAPAITGCVPKPD